MSIILEALKKASSNKNTQTYVATTAVKQEKKADTARTDPLDGSNFSMSMTMFMAVGTIIAVGVVSYLTSTINREVALVPENIKPIAEGYVPPQVPVASAAKQETTPIGSLINKLSNPHLTLNGIVYGIGKPAAIIENKILEEGSSIKGSRVIKINIDSVEMIDVATGQNFVLKVD